MPGYAFHLEVLKQARLVLSDEDRGYQTLLESPYAGLGAFGPDLLVYTPPIDELATDLADADLLQQVLSKTNPVNRDLTILEDLFQKPVGAAYSALFSKLVIPLWPDLITIISFVAQAATIAHSEDSSALAGFFDQLPSVKAALANLGTNTAPALTTLLSLATVIVGGPWMEVGPASAAALLLIPRADPQACRPYEFLRWHRSGEFAAALWTNAESDNQKAFALGWMSHIGASVTGEPFVNNVVGGPYRTHWWRNRLASNFVDAWTFGFYEDVPLVGQATRPSMNGDAPTPAYPDWAPLYGANLQQRFDVSNLSGLMTNGIPDAVTAMSEGISTSTPNTMTNLAGRFPSEISDQLNAALEQTYPASDARLKPPPSLTADSFADAYVGAFAVYWYLTSGDGPLGNNIPTPAPTGTCATEPPSWTTSPSTPPPQSGSVVTQSGGGVCDAVLAILAILGFLTGNIAAGIGLGIAALEDLPSADINWPQVQCDVFWIESLVDKLLNVLRDALVMMTLAYPPPILLGGEDMDGNPIPATDFTDVSTGEDPPATFNGNDAPTGGVPLTRTNGFSTFRGRGGDGQGAYPRGLDKGPGPDGAAIVPDLDFFRFPGSAPLETSEPAFEADVMIPAGLYPDGVVNNGGRQNGGIMQPPAAFPSTDLPLGDCVTAAADVIRAKANGLPDYNLDGDRGYGWLGWRPKPLTDPGTPPVQVEQDS